MRSHLQTVKFCIPILMASFISMMAFGHGDKSVHVAEFKAVINGYDDPTLNEFYTKFSSGIDHGLLNDIRNALGEKFGCSQLHVSFGDHRFYAHSWPFGESIPRNRLDKIEQIHQGAWEAINPVWKRFCGEHISYVMKELKFPRNQARSFCAVLYYVHLLGDWDPKDNSMFKYVMPCSEIVERLNRQLTVIFINHAEMASEIRSQLSAAAASSPNDCQKALAIMSALRELKIGTKIHETWGQYFESKHHPYKEEAAQPQLQKAA